MLSLLSNPLLLVINIAAILIALSFHEFGHAFVSYKLGDDTPLRDGRVSLDPLRHIDILGFLCLVFFRFGWAKPVHVDASRYKNVRGGMLLVSLSGILMNLALAFLGLLLMYASQFYFGFTNQTYYVFLQVFVMINLSLMVFNLLPIPPLDGYEAITALFYRPQNFWFFNFVERYGRYILIGLVLLGALTPFISGSVNKLYELLSFFALKLLGIY